MPGIQDAYAVNPACGTTSTWITWVSDSTNSNGIGNIMSIDGVTVSWPYKSIDKSKGIHNDNGVDNSPKDAAGRRELDL